MHIFKIIWCFMIAVVDTFLEMCKQLCFQLFAVVQIFGEKSWSHILLHHTLSSFCPMED